MMDDCKHFKFCYIEHHENITVIIIRIIIGNKFRDIESTKKQ